MSLLLVSSYALETFRLWQRYCFGSVCSIRIFMHLNWESVCNISVCLAWCFVNLMHSQHWKCEQPISLAKIKFQTNRGWLRNVQVWCSPNDTIVGRWRSSLLFILENNRTPKCQNQWVSIPWNLIHYRNNNKDPRSKTIFSPSLFPLPSFPLPTK